MVEQSAGALLISTADERNEFTLVSGRCSTVFCAFKMQFPRNEGLILTLLGQELEKLPNEIWMWINCNKSKKAFQSYLICEMNHARIIREAISEAKTNEFKQQSTQ